MKSFLFVVTPVSAEVPKMVAGVHTKESYYSLNLNLCSVNGGLNNVPIYNRGLAKKLWKPLNYCIYINNRRKCV